MAGRMQRFPLSPAAPLYEWRPSSFASRAHAQNLHCLTSIQIHTTDMYVHRHTTKMYEVHAIFTDRLQITTCTGRRLPQQPPEQVARAVQAADYHGSCQSMLIQEGPRCAPTAHRWWANTTPFRHSKTDSASTWWCTISSASSGWINVMISLSMT
jgi:hypothetical protein